MKKRKSKGFSLLESLVGTSVFAILTTSMLGFIQISSVQFSNSSNQFLATLVAQDQLQSAVRQGYAVVRAMPNPEYATPQTAVYQNQDSGNSIQQNFNWNVNHYSAIAGGAEEVVVTVNWTQKTAQSPITKSTSVSTWVTP